MRILQWIAVTVCIVSSIPIASAQDGLLFHLAPMRGVPFVCDASANRFHALYHGGAIAIVQGPRKDMPALVIRRGEWLELPEARLIFGNRTEQGSICLWVRPAFEPMKLPSGLWEGYAVLIYIQKRSGNGLPDGFNEIGIFLHGPRMVAKAVGGKELAPFANIPTPLRNGQWTHLAITWSPIVRRLYVNGRLTIERKGKFAPIELDDFPATIACHPPSKRWFFHGAIADVRIYKRPLNHMDISAIFKGMR